MVILDTTVTVTDGPNGTIDLGIGSQATARLTPMQAEILAVELIEAVKRTRPRPLFPESEGDKATRLDSQSFSDV